MHLMALESSASSRTLAVILETGDELMSTLEGLARTHGWRACHFTAIGAFSEAVLAFFDWERREYLEIPIGEQVEVLSLAGDIAVKDGEPRVHAHVVVGKRDGTAHGGHVKRAVIRPTLELIVIETNGTLERRYDPESQLDLIRPPHTRGGRSG